MSLENKIINPMAPAELPGQGSETLPKAGKKRRKSGGNASAALGKAKKGDLDDEVGGDSTAVLTLGASDDARKPQKKMLFESASDGATLAFTGPAIYRETPKAATITKAAVAPATPAAKVPQPAAAKPVPAAATPAVAKIASTTLVEAKSVPQPASVGPVPVPVAAMPATQVEEIAAATPAKTNAASEPLRAEPAPAPVAPTPVAEIEKSEPVAPIETKSALPRTAAPAPIPETKDAAPIAAMKSSVFQVATLVMREPDPLPERKDADQAELALTVESSVAESAEIATTAAAPAVDVQPETFDESLTLAFDATLAEGLAERSAAVEKEVAAEPMPPAPTAADINELKRPETAPAAIERAFRADPLPAPAAIEPPPAPVSVAPVAEAPKAEPKPESETPSRAGLSRSEMIARAARLSVRATARPTPTAAETLAAARTAQQQLRSTDLPKNPGDIYGYWTRVKNGRRFPSRADFDAEQVAENWPNSMLLTCGNGTGSGSQGNFSSVLRLGANRRTRPGDDLSFTSMITEWILTTGGEAARAGTPVQDTEVFPTPDGTHAYKIVALPLSENQTRVDHVLCHLSRS
jgi:hypothetical protein